MVRRVLTLLLALPLLLPPGVCVCGLAQASTTPADCPVPAAAEAPTCPCCQHCVERAADDHEANAVASPASPLKGDQHPPGCPARRGVAQWKCSSPAPVLPQIAALDAPYQPLPADPVLCACITLRSVERPIYLTTLTLRI